MGNAFERAETVDEGPYFKASIMDAETGFYRGPRNLGKLQKHKNCAHALKPELWPSTLRKI